MDLKISCPNCDQHIVVDSSGIGQQVACPTCSKPFIIAAPPPLSKPRGAPGQPSGAGSPRSPVYAVLVAATILVLIATAVTGGYYFYNSRNHVRRPAEPPKPAIATPPAIAPHVATGGQTVATNINPATNVVQAIPDAWRNDLGTFVKEVLAVAQRSSTPSEEAWSIGGRDGLQRLGSILTSKGVDVGFIPHDAGMDGELSTELLKRFGTGTVTWQGVVKSATNDVAREVQIIQIAMPPHDGLVQIQPLKFEIPFSKLSLDHAPKVGDPFAFTASLQGKEDDPLFKEAVAVIYWFAASGNPGKESVVVSLAGVSPAAKIEQVAPDRDGGAMPLSMPSTNGINGTNGPDIPAKQ